VVKILTLSWFSWLGYMMVVVVTTKNKEEEEEEKE
jgi:hypothetical protein